MRLQLLTCFCSISAQCEFCYFVYLLFLILKKPTKNKNSILRTFNWCINISDIFDVEIYFTICLRLKEAVLNSLSNVTEDLNLKSVLLISLESNKECFEAFTLYRWKTPLIVSCVNGEKISNCSQPCQNVVFFVFEIFFKDTRTITFLAHT